MQPSLKSKNTPEIIKRLTGKQPDNAISAEMQAGIYRCDQFIVLAVAKTISRQQLDQMLKKIAGQVVWYQPEIDLYFVEPNDSYSKPEWQKLYEQLEKNPMMRAINQFDLTTQPFIDQQYKL